jgi:hypothetical protein
MLQRFIACFLCFGLIMTAASPVHAQGGERERDGEITQKGPRKQITTIVFAGLAGAVLGLSTLSFYGRPQEKLSNIAVGFAIGVIGGAMYTTFQAASNPRDFYSFNPPKGEVPQTIVLHDAVRDQLALGAKAATLGLSLEF